MVKPFQAKRWNIESNNGKYQLDWWSKFLVERYSRLYRTRIKDLEAGIFTSDKALKGKHKGKFRKRAGNYRIIYLKENDILVITLIRIVHRKEVYWRSKKKPFKLYRICDNPVFDIITICREWRDDRNYEW